MQFILPSLCFALLSSVVSCAHRDPRSQPAQRVDAEVVVRSTDPEARCQLNGDLYVSRQKTQTVTDSKWNGVATDLRSGDLVVLHASIVGTNTWACEAECSLRQVGTPNRSTSKVSSFEKRPAPTCPGGGLGPVTCIFQVPSGSP